MPSIIRDSKHSHLAVKEAVPGEEGGRYRPNFCSHNSSTFPTYPQGWELSTNNARIKAWNPTCHRFFRSHLVPNFCSITRWFPLEPPFHTAIYVLPCNKAFLLLGFIIFNSASHFGFLRKSQLTMFGVVGATADYISKARIIYTLSCPIFFEWFLTWSKSSDAMSWRSIRHCK